MNRTAQIPTPGEDLVENSPNLCEEFVRIDNLRHDPSLLKLGKKLDSMNEISCIDPVLGGSLFDDHDKVFENDMLCSKYRFDSRSIGQMQVRQALHVQTLQENVGCVRSPLVVFIP